MRKPVDNLSIVDDMLRSLRVIEFAAMFADILVLIEAMMLILVLHNVLVGLPSPLLHGGGRCVH
jgi:hypothetical protein